MASNSFSLVALLDWVSKPLAPRTRAHIRNALDSSQGKIRPLPQPPLNKAAPPSSLSTSTSATAAMDAAIGQSTLDMPSRHLKRSRVIAPSSQPAVLVGHPVASTGQVDANNVLPESSMRAQLLEHGAEPSSSRGISRGLPLFSEITRLIILKDDYRDPSSTSRIMRSKINYLRFEMGYRGLRRVRGDGSSFYRCTLCFLNRHFQLSNTHRQIAFALGYLERIYTASNRAAAVANALRYLEIAQNLVDPTMPEHEWVRKIDNAQV